MKNAVLILLSLLLWCCETMTEPIPEDSTVRHFVIPQGQHYAKGRSIESLQSGVLSFTARFDQSAIYYFEDASFQDSKNKLLGFSDCNSDHHDNSARFGWQWYNDQLEIYAYCYVNTVRVEKFVGVVELEKENSFELRISDGYYSFILNNGEPVTIERGNVCDQGNYYMLWPYFGGQIPAPHDVTIEIQINR